LAHLTTDHSTVTAHAEGNITIGKQSCFREEAVDILESLLDSLGLSVREKRRLPLGKYRGLNFGLVFHPGFAPELYLEGEAALQSTLSREHHGPRAILNALERLGGSYVTECTRVRQNLEVAESQLRDYQASLGKPFLHDSYMSELSALRDELRAGLSGNASEGDTEGPPSVSEIAERIRALKASHTTQGEVQRSGQKHSSGEEPVTLLIRRGAESIQAVDPMRAYPVGSMVNNPRNQGPGCIEQAE
jgi:hypothetical protein